MSLRSRYQESMSTEMRYKSGDSFGILLPNVQKNQYKRYERVDRYRSNKPFNNDRLLSSVYVQNLLQSTANLSTGQKSMNTSGFITRLQREVSLVDKIRSKVVDKSC